MTTILQTPAEYAASLLAHYGDAVEAVEHFRKALITEASLRHVPSSWSRDVEAALGATEPKPLSAKMKYLVEAVKAHAIANYNRDGWDLVVETMTDREIAAELKHDMWTAKQAIRLVGKGVKVVADYRAEIQSTEF
jgi:hypothetical protein